MLSVLLPFRILGVLMIILGVLAAFIIVATPFADQLLIPTVLFEWGLDPRNFVNSLVLWILFGFIFGSGCVLLFYSTDKERRAEVMLVSAGILILIGSFSAICLFLYKSGILYTDNVISLWILLFVCYIIGLWLIRRNSPKMEELMQRDRERLVKARENQAAKEEAARNVGANQDQPNNLDNPTDQPEFQQ